ncbi:hypothetical protein ACSSS7_000356 [Eimeria intestinalis]
MAARTERYHRPVTLQLLILAILASIGHCILRTHMSGADWEALPLPVERAASPTFHTTCSESRTLPWAFLLMQSAAHFRPSNRAPVRSTAGHAARDDAAAPAAVTRGATQLTVAKAKPLSLLERVQLHQDVGAAEQLLRLWEEQRDALLLTSWDNWAAAVGVSVQQLQQVVLLVHSAPVTSITTKQRHRRKRAVAEDAPAIEGRGAHVLGNLISCAGGVLSATAYKLLQSLLPAEGALLLKGPQCWELLGLCRPPSVQEWAAAAAADATAADAAASAAHALGDAPDFAKAASTSAKELDNSQLAANADTGCDLNATEKQQRAALFKQLTALHALMSWQQQQLTPTATAAVRKFRGVGASRQEQRLAAAEGEDADSAAAAAAGTCSQDGLMLMALQHAREGLKKRALDSLEVLHLSSSVLARPTVKDGASLDNSEASSSSSCDRKGDAAAAPSWITYWGWLQQGMTRWSRMQRVPYDIPAGWWAAAAALRRVRHQQDTDELLHQEDQLDFQGPLTQEEKTQQECSSLSVSPQRLRAVQLGTRKPISTEAELMGHKADRGTLHGICIFHRSCSSRSRTCFVSNRQPAGNAIACFEGLACVSCEKQIRIMPGVSLAICSAAWVQEEQQQRMLAAADEIWQFAAANLKPEQLQALQEAAESPLSAGLQTREPLLQSAVRRLREAELKRLMQQLPAERRAAAATDLALQRQLLAEQSHLVRLVRDACSQ